MALELDIGDGELGHFCMRTPGKRQETPGNARKFCEGYLSVRVRGGGINGAWRVQERWERAARGCEGGAMVGLVCLWIVTKRTLYTGGASHLVCDNITKPDCLLETFIGVVW